MFIRSYFLNISYENKLFSGKGSFTIKITLINNVNREDMNNVSININGVINVKIFA